MNKSYCPLVFKEIYSSNLGAYNLCCRAIRGSISDKFKTNDITPFKFFFSKEMEEIREKMLNGETIPLCIKCYGQEETVGYSARTKLIDKCKNEFPTKVEKIALKLRMYGNYCNLSCVMCQPHNSTTKSNELRDSGLSQFFHHEQTSRTYSQWQETKKDVLDHIHLIDKFHLTGGEPLLLPKHWELMMEIPDDMAKNISLTYDTNFTSLKYKNHSIYDLVDKFKKVNFNVSCDHYKDKLSFIRYPIDVESFEDNLIEAKEHIGKLSCTVFILNVADVIEIKNYYRENFDIKLETPSTVHYPMMLNVRHLPDDIKNSLIEKYSNLDGGGNFITELHKTRDSAEFQKGLFYLWGMASHRKMDIKKLWPEFFEEGWWPEYLNE